MTILMVEDHLYYAMPAISELGTRGFDVDTAEDAGEALRKLSGEQVLDLLIVDLSLPLGDMTAGPETASIEVGWVLIDRLRSSGGRNAQVPTIVVSAYRDTAPDLQSRMERLGVAAAFGKASTSAKDLTDFVSNLLAGQNQG